MNTEPSTSKQISSKNGLNVFSPFFKIDGKKEAEYFVSASKHIEIKV